jgi:hypothetical protein
VARRRPSCTVRHLLGDANVSQTDAYPGAKIAGQRTKMERFDAARRKAVAKPATIKYKPVSHHQPADSPKDQLH